MRKDTKNKLLTIITFIIAAFIVVFYAQQLLVITFRHADTYSIVRHPQNHIAVETPDERIADWTEALALITLLLATISVVQIAFLIRADKTARISAQAANKAADAALSQVEMNKETAKAATQSALAATVQVEISREASITTERAFVFCERIEHLWRANKDTEEMIEWVFYPVWKNSGNTPTLRAKSSVSTWVAIDVGDLPASFTYPDYGAPEPIMLGPGLTRNGVQLRIPLGTMDKIYKGTAHAYMWGWIDYDTVFVSDTAKHRTEFCVEIQVVGNPKYKEGRFAFRAHGRFNGFDDECYRWSNPPS